MRQFGRVVLAGIAAAVAFDVFSAQVLVSLFHTGFAAWLGWGTTRLSDVWEWMAVTVAAEAVIVCFVVMEVVAAEIVAVAAAGIAVVTAVAVECYLTLRELQNNSIKFMEIPETKCI